MCPAPLLVEGGSGALLLPLAVAEWLVAAAPLSMSFSTSKLDTDPLLALSTGRYFDSGLFKKPLHLVVCLTRGQASIARTAVSDSCNRSSSPATYKYPRARPQKWHQKDEEGRISVATSSTSGKMVGGTCQPRMVKSAGLLLKLYTQSTRMASKTPEKPWVGQEGEKREREKKEEKTVRRETSKDTEHKPSNTCSAVVPEGVIDAKEQCCQASGAGVDEPDADGHAQQGVAKPDTAEAALNGRRDHAQGHQVYSEMDNVSVQQRVAH